MGRIGREISRGAFAVALAVGVGLFVRYAVDHGNAATWFLLGMLVGVLATRLLPMLPRQGQVRVRRLGHHPRALAGRDWREKASCPK